VHLNVVKSLNSATIFLIFELLSFAFVLDRVCLFISILGLVRDHLQRKGQFVVSYSNA